MKLVIREYLSMLKESGELDVLLPDLLLAMGIAPLSKAQVGVRQYGVDIAARGIDPDDNVDKLLLLTVKQGDLSRNNWDSGKKQDVRPSLNEIIDVYLTKSIDEEHKSLIKKIIVCCNGDIKQDVEQNWLGYKESNTKAGIEFDFWGADKLSLMIEQYLLNEYLFPEKSRKYLRRTIALADQNEVPQYFYALIEETLFENNLFDNNKTPSLKKLSKLLSVLDLSLNIVFHWCLEANNLKPALLCAERSILRTWEWLIKNDLLKEQKIFSRYNRIVMTYSKVITAFINKIEPYCLVQHGLFGWAEAEEIEYPLRTFEVVGILGSCGILIWNWYSLTKNEDYSKALRKEFKETANILESLIINNPSCFTPLFDRHANDIAVGLIVLQLAGKFYCAKHWLNHLTSSIYFGYQLGHHFPLHTNSYNDLITITVEKSPSKDKLTKASTLLSLLADWYAILDLEEEYKEFQKIIKKEFSHTNLMQWFPDDTTDSFFYSTNAGHQSGVGVGLQLHKSIDDIRKRTIKLQEEYLESFNNMSCVKYNNWSLIAIASRHFNTPVIPFMWHQFLQEKIKKIKMVKSL